MCARLSYQVALSADKPSSSSSARRSDADRIRHAPLPRFPIVAGQPSRLKYARLTPVASLANQNTKLKFGRIFQGLIAIHMLMIRLKGAIATILFGALKKPVELTTQPASGDPTRVDVLSFQHVEMHLFGILIIKFDRSPFLFRYVCSGNSVKSSMLIRVRHSSPKELACDFLTQRFERALQGAKRHPAPDNARISRLSDLTTAANILYASASALNLERSTISAPRSAQTLVRLPLSPSTPYGNQQCNDHVKRICLHFQETHRVSSC